MCTGWAKLGCAFRHFSETLSCTAMKSCLPLFSQLGWDFSHIEGGMMHCREKAALSEMRELLLVLLVAFAAII
jgi:hypothetical protein